MAQVNRTYAYIRDVEGITPWEKLRNIRSFLSDRKQALKIAILTNDDFLENISLKTKFEVAEFEIKKEFNLSLIEDCKREINFLELYEKQLMTEAYKSRVENLTDEEMYEYNFILESRLRLLHRATAELLSQGSISVDTFQTCLKEPDVLKELSLNGLLSANLGAALENIKYLGTENNSKLALTLITSSKI